MFDAPNAMVYKKTKLCCRSIINDYDFCVVERKQDRLLSGWQMLCETSRYCVFKFRSNLQAVKYIHLNHRNNPFDIDYFNTMSVIGLDFGNNTLLIAQTTKGGVDLVLNDASNRQTATFVSMLNKQRFMGDAAASMARSNYTNTVSLMKLLVGRLYDDADVKSLLRSMPFTTSKIQSTGGIGITLTYDDRAMVVSAEHVFAMMLVKAKEIASAANGNIGVGDAVLAVPDWFADTQRMAIMLACEIASLHCLKVMNESTAIALSYGIFKSAKGLFSDVKSTYIMFIDVGYTCYNVSIVEFVQERMKVLSSVCDCEGVNGKAFDNIIIQFLVESFLSKTGIDISNNTKALLKLQAAAEKAKKTLSPAGVTEASISVECLADDKDLSIILTKREFERRAAAIIECLEGPLMQAMSEAKLSSQQIHEVEIVGGTSRVNLVKRKLGELLRLDPNSLNSGLKTTMNADEAVARGCALQCAILSSRIKVKPFHIVDRMYYGVVARFDGVSVPLFSRGEMLPCEPKRLTFKEKVLSDFDIELYYDDDIATKGIQNKFIASYRIEMAAVTGGSCKDLIVTFNIDKNSCVYIDSAKVMEEVAVEAADTINSIPKVGSKDSIAKDSNCNSPINNENRRKRFKKVETKLIRDHRLRLSSADIRSMIKTEQEMASNDRLIVETFNKRNELETYLYNVRGRVDGALGTCCLPVEAQAIRDLLAATESWLYDEGFDTSKDKYIDQIDRVRSSIKKAEGLLYEDQNRPVHVDKLRFAIEETKTIISKLADDSIAEVAEVKASVEAQECWLAERLSLQGELGPAEEPALTCAMLQAAVLTVGKLAGMLNIRQK